MRTDILLEFPLMNGFNTAGSPYRHKNRGRNKPVIRRNFPGPCPAVPVFPFQPELHTAAIVNFFV
jgi:hypothetical protein